MKKKRTPRARSAARQAAASAAKVTGLREKLAALSAGGSPAVPIVVPSAAVIEIRALTEPCPACEAPLQLVAHEADGSAGKLLRRVDLRCLRCAHAVTRWFSVTAPLLH